MRSGPESDVQADTDPVPGGSPSAWGSAGATPRQSCEAVDESQQRSLGAPTIVGEYRLLKRLGRGTFGEVWLAEERVTGKRAAVKFMNGPVGQGYQDLLQEVRNLARLHGDPGIVQVYDVVAHGERPYFLMQYAEGGSLADRIRDAKVAAGRGIPVAEAVELFRQICAAMDYVHVKGVRHCDLKPSNILLDSVGRPLVGDFGQAHLADDTAPALGSFLYMAPEQATQQALNPDSRWDVHALGAILYELISGEPPRYDAREVMEIGRTSPDARQLERYREFVRAAARPTRHVAVLGRRDRPLAAIIDCCLDPDPARRLKDAGAVLPALDRRERLLKQRTGTLFGAIATAALLAATAGTAAWSMRNNYENSRDNLVQQVREHHLISAAMAGNVLGEKFRQARQAAERWAADEPIRNALNAGSREAMQRRARALYAAARDDRAANGEPWIAGVTVVDGRGDLLAKYFGEAPGEEPFRHRWAWRRWFNGVADFPDHDAGYPPLATTRTFPPYRGILANERDRCVITTSAPILDDETPPRSEPAGVLAVTVDLRSLLEWLEPVRIDGGGVLIVDESNAVWWPSPVPDELAVQLPPHRELSRGRGTSVATHERDRGRRFLVSWSPVDGRGAGTLGELVVVVVQAERDAVRSLDEMHKKASGHAFWLGVFVATVVAAGWAALIVRRARAEATVYV